MLTIIFTDIYQYYGLWALWSWDFICGVIACYLLVQYSISFQYTMRYIVDKLELQKVAPA